MNNGKYQSVILNYKLSPYLVAVTFLLAFLSWLLLSNEDMLDFVAEFGIVENLTVVIYIIAAILIWCPAVISKSTMLTRISSTVIVVAMALREADMHKYINGISMFKIKFWLGDYPIENKIITFMVILPIVLSLAFLVIKYNKTFFKEINQHKTSAITLLTFIIATFASKIIDRSVDVITDIISIKIIPLWILSLQNAVEEYLELLLPVLIIIFIIQYIFEDRMKVFNQSTQKIEE